MRENRLKAALARGERQVGTWLHTLGMPQTIQILATAGFDYVYIDLEHSAFSIETAAGLCAAGLKAGIVPIVRPPAPDFHLLSRPLDNGAMGILMPHVDTGAEAEAAVHATKFAPVGGRGSAPASAHTDFAAAAGVDYMAKFNEESILIVQIESPEALANLDEILAVPGIDGASVGRGDLAIELGHPGERNHPEVLAGVDAMIAACHRHGKVPSLLVYDVEDGAHWASRGITMMTYSTEVVMLREAAKSAVGAIRAAH